MKHADDFFRSVRLLFSENIGNKKASSSSDPLRQDSIIQLPEDGHQPIHQQQLPASTHNHYRLCRNNNHRPQQQQQRHPADENHNNNNDNVKVICNDSNDALANEDDENDINMLVDANEKEKLTRSSDNSNLKIENRSNNTSPDLNQNFEKIICKEEFLSPEEDELYMDMDTDIDTDTINTLIGRNSNSKSISMSTATINNLATTTSSTLIKDSGSNREFVNSSSLPSPSSATTSVFIKNEPILGYDDNIMMTAANIDKFMVAGRMRNIVADPLAVDDNLFSFDREISDYCGFELMMQDFRNMIKNNQFDYQKYRGGQSANNTLLPLENNYIFRPDNEFTVRFHHSSFEFNWRAGKEHFRLFIKTAINMKLKSFLSDFYQNFVLSGYLMGTRPPNKVLQAIQASRKEEWHQRSLAKKRRLFEQFQQYYQYSKRYCASIKNDDQHLNKTIKTINMKQEDDYKDSIKQEKGNAVKSNNIAATTVIKEEAIISKDEKQPDVELIKFEEIFPSNIGDDGISLKLDEEDNDEIDGVQDRIKGNSSNNGTIGIDVDLDSDSRRGAHLFSLTENTTVAITDSSSLTSATLSAEISPNVNIDSSNIVVNYLEKTAAITIPQYVKG